jgi:hypothetical protein
MLAPLLGYFFCMVTVLTAVVVALTGFSNISTIGNGRHYPRPPVIGRTVMVETQRHSPPVAKESSLAKSIAKEASPAKDVSPVVATAAKAETKKVSNTNPKCSPVSTTTTATGTRWDMHKNLGTAQKVFFSNDPIIRLARDDDVLPAISSAMLVREK